MHRIAYAVLTVLVAGTVTSVSAYTGSGYITSDETWSPSDGEIRVTGDITVRSGATLTIEPGTVVGGYSGTSAAARMLYASGTGAVYAAGTAADTIRFNRVRVEFVDLTRDDANLLEYCRFSGGWGHALVEFRNSGTPSTENELSHVTIRNCSFMSSGYCQVYITSGASPTFENCYFYGSNTGIFSHGSDTLTVKNCIFNDHGCGIVCGSYGGMFYEPMVCIVDHCTFNNINNTRSVASYLTPCQGMGICSINEAGRLDVTNSVFYDIAGSGIRDWNIEDSNFDENWDVTNDYNIFYETGGDPCRMMDMGAHSQEADPLLGDAPAFALGTGSPAIDAASDGTNMGAWQGDVSSVCPVVSGSSRNGVSVIVTAADGAVRFGISGAVSGDLVVYDAAGAVVARMAAVDGAVWRTAAAGVYYVRLTADPAGAVARFVRM